MKKPINAIAVGAVALVLLLLASYLYGYTRTDQSELYLTPTTDDPCGWDIWALENGARVPLSVQDSWDYPGTVYLERVIPADWAAQGYHRVKLTTGRWYSVFVDGALVYTNCAASSGFPVAFPSGGAVDWAASPGFSLSPEWADHTLMVATALIGPEGAASPGFNVTSEAVDEAVTTAWAAASAMPAALFAALGALLLVLFAYGLTQGRPYFGLLALAAASLAQMFYHLSMFRASPGAHWLRPLFLHAFLLLPMLCCGLSMKKQRKRFLPLLLACWGIPFAAQALQYAVDVPLWLLDTSPYLLFFPLAALLWLGTLERREGNPAFRLLIPGLKGCLGLLAFLFLLSLPVGAAMPHSAGLLAWVRDTVRGVAGLYPHRLLYLLNTLLLLLLFLTAVVEQVRRGLKQEDALALLAYKNDLALESIRALEQSGEALAVARHDQIHHLRVLAGMCRESPGQAAEYAASLASELAGIPSMHFTENRLVNTILTVQAEKAGQRSVSFQAEALLPPSLPIPDRDLCAVLMNLLDNAVNSAALAPQKREVSIRLTTEDGYLLIAIENTLPEGFDQNAFRETLSQAAVPGRDSHGFGIRSAQAAVSRYGGELRYAVRDGVLTVNTAMGLANP